MPLRFAIVGPGRVGSALARLLSEADYTFLGASGRTVSSARQACALAGTGRPTDDPCELAPRADLLFITTPDEAVRHVAAALGRGRALKAGAVVAHCSGALTSSILADVRTCGAHAGSLHPLQSFATVDQALALLSGSYCCIEGDSPAVAVLDDVARALRMHVVRVATEHKALYHAAAVLASNGLVALQAAAVRLASQAGVAPPEALPALLPLVKGTVSNLERVGLPAALTGPVERGDIDTVERHLRAIRQQAPDLLGLYCALGIQTLQVAADKGSISAQQRRRLLDILDTDNGQAQGPDPT